MKMIWAIIRPEYSQKVIDALEKIGISAMTRLHVTGHGAEIGITANYSEIPKEMLMLVLPDIDVARAVKIIRYRGENLAEGKSQAWSCRGRQDICDLR